MRRGLSGSCRETKTPLLSGRATGSSKSKQLRRTQLSQAFFSHVWTTNRVALSPRLATACSFVISAEPSVTTVTFWVPAASPFSMRTVLKPGNVPNAELTLFLHPPQVTPVIPATYVASPAQAAGAKARANTARLRMSDFIGGEIPRNERFGQRKGFAGSGYSGCDALARPCASISRFRFFPLANSTPSQATSEPSGAG